MFFILFLFIGLWSSSLPLLSRDYNRHNPYRRNKPPVERVVEETPERPLHRSTPPTPTSDEPVHTAEPGDELLAADTSDLLPLSQDEQTPHTPLGAICIEIKEYCSYFAHSSLQESVPANQKQSLELFCNLLELLANLADGDCGIIRLNSYLSNVVKLTQNLAAVNVVDPAMKDHPAEYPFTNELVATMGADGEDTPSFVQHALCSPESAVPLIQTLFSELKTYAHYKLHAILETFERDTKILLERAQNPTESAEDDTIVSPQRQNMNALGWLCRHAASTCADLVLTIPSSPLLSHTSSLMNQVQLMFSTMALTYSHLGANTVRSQDRSTLAKQYACLIEQMDSFPTRRGSRSHLQYVQSLPSLIEKQTYIDEIFSSSIESSLFLHELFPCFNDALDYNLTQFSITLSNEVIKVLSNRYWMNS